MNEGFTKFPNAGSKFEDFLVE